MDYINSIIIILITSAVVVFLLHKAKVPPIVGFVIAGDIIGPYGFGLVKDLHTVEVLAEIGIVFLMFTIGIEFSFSKLLRMKKVVFVCGTIQVLITILLVFFIVYFLVGDVKRAIFYGFLISLSSTAIVMKLLADKGEIDTPHGKNMLGILIFQDLCVIPFMLFVPILAGQSADFFNIMLTLGKAGLILLIVVVAAKYIIPLFLYEVVKTRSRELFIITIIVLSVGISIITGKLGLSFAFGAFLAGLIISESEYAHQATSDILPFKESFMSMFFVSMGMLINMRYVIENWQIILLVLMGALVIKMFALSIASIAIGNHIKVTIKSVFGLAQMGEFSFVLALAGKKAGLFSEDYYQLFIAFAIISMIMTPLFIEIATRHADWIGSKKLIIRFHDIIKPAEFDRLTKKFLNM